jgi:hypothetical protein
VRAFDMAGLYYIKAIGIGGDGDWLFAVGGESSCAAYAVALIDRPERSWKATRIIGVVCEEQCVDVRGAVAVGDMLLISHVTEERIDILPLPASLM